MFTSCKGLKDFSLSDNNWMLGFYPEPFFCGAVLRQQQCHRSTDHVVADDQKSRQQTERSWMLRQQEMMVGRGLLGPMFTWVHR